MGLKLVAARMSYEFYYLIFNKLITKKEYNNSKMEGFIYSLFFVICKARSAYLVDDMKLNIFLVKIY